MNRVIILSPYKGDISANLAYAWLCVLDSMKRDEAPWASHLFYTEVLRDSDPAQRAKGFECEAAWLRAADLVAVYTDRGLSSGMLKTLDMMRKDYPWIKTEMRSIK